MLRRSFLKLMALVGFGGAVKATGAVARLGVGVRGKEGEGVTLIIGHRTLQVGDVVLRDGESAKCVDGVWRKV